MWGRRKGGATVRGQAGQQRSSLARAQKRVADVPPTRGQVRRATLHHHETGGQNRTGQGREGQGG
eukprot:6635539-Alexandrium_andersonii.AAC.1